MPREKIYTERESGQGDEPSSDPTGVEIQWGPHGAASDTAAVVDIRAGNLGLDFEDGAPTFVNMNRRQINKVISVLRRARRATYGDDE